MFHGLSQTSNALRRRDLPGQGVSKAVGFFTPLRQFFGGSPTAPIGRVVLGIWKRDQSWIIEHYVVDSNRGNGHSPVVARTLRIVYFGALSDVMNRGSRRIGPRIVRFN